VEFLGKGVGGGGGGCKGNLHQVFSLWNLFQRCSGSSGSVPRGLRAIGPLMKCLLLLLLLRLLLLLLHLLLLFVLLGLPIANAPDVL
jgi:hypothetical protein